MTDEKFEVESKSEATGSVVNGQETQLEETKGKTPETTESKQTEKPVTPIVTQAKKANDLSWSKEELDEYDRETVEGINKREEICESRLGRYRYAKEAASEAKKDYDAAIKTLTEYIRERKNAKGKPRQKTLFDRPSLDVGQQSENEPEPTLSTVEPAEPVEDTSWRDVEISYLTQHGLSESTANAIEDTGINTIGKLADFTTKNQLIDLKKIGTAKAEAIEKALESFWAERNRASSVEPSEPEGDEEEDIIDGVDDDAIEPSDEPTDEAEPETTTQPELKPALEFADL